jgi:hypothetical protein
MGVEPMNTGFADQRVSHFATGALVRRATTRVARRIIPKLRGVAHTSPSLLRLRRRPQVWLHRLVPGEDLRRIII